MDALSEERFVGSGACKGDIPARVSDISLTVAFTTDLHGHVKSLPRISTLVKDYRKQGPTLFLDSGDISIGTLFAKVHGAQGMSELMSFMGYQAIALGNHDLEYATQLSSNFPVISVNIPGFTNSTTIQVQGVMIGVLAYTITTTENTTHALTELLHTIKQEAYCLRKSGAELVILLSHGVASMDKHIASETTGFIDAILGGHTHALLGCTKAYHNGTVIMNTGAAGEFLGVLKVSRTAGKTTYYSDLIPIEANIPEDPVLKAYLAPLLAALPTRNRLIATLSTPCTAADQASTCRQGVCVTGEIIATAVRWFHGCIVVALFEAGSIRDVFRSNISQFDLISTLPWENTVVLYTTSGRNVLDMLQHGARSVALTGEAYLHTAGISYDSHTHLGYLESGADADDTIHHSVSKDTSISVRHSEHSKHSEGAMQGHIPPRGACNAHSKHRMQLSTSTRKLDPSATYTIAVTDWLASGGDGYGAYLARATRLPDTAHSTVFVRDMVERYLTSAPPIVVHNNTDGAAQDPQLRWQLHSLPHNITTDNDHRDILKVGNAMKGRAVVDHSSLWAETTQFLHHWGCTAGMRSLVAILAEVPATLISHPLRTISTRQQSKTHSSSYTGLWNGALLTLIAVMTSKTVFWTVYYFALEQLSAASGLAPSAVQQGLLGFYSSLLAGVCECIIVHPLWVVVIRIQVFGYKVNDLYRNICDGLGFSLLLVLFPCIRQFMFEYFMYIYDAILELRTAPFVNGAIGTVATITATVLSYPIQTLRTQSQTRSYEGILSMKLFNGLGAKILSAAVQAFCFFFCKKLLEIVLLGK